MTRTRGSPRADSDAVPGRRTGPTEIASGTAGRRWPGRCAALRAERADRARPAAHRHVRSGRTSGPRVDRRLDAQQLVLLAEVVRACDATLQEVDLLARVGGEEFVLVLPDIAPADTSRADHQGGAHA
ncbi:MAG: diguanylate cyclase [Nitriliruptoraceae bacterium]